MRIYIVVFWVVILKMGAVRSSKTLVSYHITTGRHNLEDVNVRLNVSKLCTFKGTGKKVSI